VQELPAAPRSNEGRPSKTSIYVAAGRAIGARDPDPAVRNPDSLAERLLGDPAALGVDHPAVHALGRDYAEAMADREVLGTVAMMMIRTRFIDECVRSAVTAGATQLVILGAGFDTRAYRLTDLLSGTTVFEVDRPQTQELKKRRVVEALGGPPANLVYVPIDFQREPLAGVLARHGHDPLRRTCFVWEGVTMYLPADAVAATLAFVGRQAAGSSIVFDYVHRRAIDMIAKIDIAQIPEAARPAVQRFLDLLAGEPWIFGLPDGGEREYLAGFGLAGGEPLPIGGPESVRRYLTRSDGTTIGGPPPERGPNQGLMYQLVEATVG
jgi:methyltransferase (TIGR00027 family)